MPVKTTSRQLTLVGNPITGLGHYPPQRAARSPTSACMSTAADVAGGAMSLCSWLNLPSPPTRPHQRTAHPSGSTEYRQKQARALRKSAAAEIYRFPFSAFAPTLCGTLTSDRACLTTGSTCSFQRHLAHRPTTGLDSRGRARHGRVSGRQATAPAAQYFAVISILCWTAWRVKLAPAWLPQWS